MASFLVNASTHSLVTVNMMMKSLKSDYRLQTFNLFEVVRFVLEQD